MVFFYTMPAARDRLVLPALADLTV